MVFSSLVFLYLFLPIALAGYFCIPKIARNAWLLAASTLFYAWGEGWYTLAMVFTIIFNWGAGLLLNRIQTPRQRRYIMALAVSVNIGLLVAYKYANFLVTTLAGLAHHLHLPEPHLDPVHLPIGISFFSFQAISYVIDVYRNDVKPTHSLLHYATYKSFFPQLIAGPIVRYRDVADQMHVRTVNVSLFARGIERFAIGLAKKTLIANLAATAADQAFTMPPGTLDCCTAWWGLLSYSMQIYFDFSGYSDMAIGMGLMFGFRFKENFDLPYTATSIRDFWRRWHISLSSWFRDYLYIPLGGSRGNPVRVCLNLFVVFLLCGLWHGASWNFILWGALHGLFIAGEHAGSAKLLERLPRIIRHIYVLLTVAFGWVLFRADDVSSSTLYFQSLLGFGGPVSSPTHPDWDVVCAIALGIFFCSGATALLFQSCATIYRLQIVLAFLRPTVPILLLIAATIMILCHGHNPFIYFRF